MVWETPYGHATHRQVRWDARNWRARMPPFGDESQRRVDSFEELDAEAGTLLLVPDDSGVELRRGLSLD